MADYVVAALYQFTRLDNCSELQIPLKERCLALGIQGTLLLAEEGINGTIAGTREGIDAILEYLRSDPRLAQLEHKESLAKDQPFYRLKVRLKQEIVTLGVDGVDPTERVGVYVEPEDWNSLISDSETLVIDTRNEYECAMGSFERAIDPETRAFREFPQWVAGNKLLSSKKKKIAMFCTGGIRCEKATSFLLQQGFEEVYHLKGGILKYLERIPVEESLWRGECFVFDQRGSVTHGLDIGQVKVCFVCSFPLSQEDILGTSYEEGVYCPRCREQWDAEQLSRFRERQHQITLANQREQPHMGQDIRIQRNQKLHSLSISHSDPILYSFRRCPYAIRARMVLQMAQIRCELREVYLKEKPTHLLKLSPKGTVPVLLLPTGEVLEESLDIMQWGLKQKDPETWKASQEHPLIDRIDNGFKQHLDLYKYASRYENVDPIEHRQRAVEYLFELETCLGENPYLGGQSRSFVDVAIFPFVRQFANVDRAYFSSLPISKVDAWLSSLMESFLFQQVMKKHTRWYLGDAPTFAFLKE